MFAKSHRSILLVGAALIATPAWAQTPAPPTITVAADDSGVAEIVVTATKRAESLQRVPISIQALGTATLEQHQVASFDDYAKLLPSVSFQSFGPGQSQLYFRGIATGGDGLHAGPLPTAGLYIDETPVTTIAGSVDIHVYDIARVEALSGPQGTLYGASSLAGTLRLITNKPDTAKFSAGYDLEGNKFGKGAYGGKAEGFVNIPLSDRAAIRLVGFYEKDGGYIDNTLADRTYQRPHTVNDGEGGTTVVNSPLTVNNAKYAKKDFNDVETYGGRAALKIDIGDTWTVTPGVIYQHQKSNGVFLFDPKVGDLQVHDFQPDVTRDEWGIASLVVQGKLSDWDVTYSGSYFKRTVDTQTDYSYFSVAYDTYTDYNFYRNAAGQDIDPSQRTHGHDSYTKQSHEFRISSPSDYRLRLTTGLFMQRQSDDQIADYSIVGLSTAVNPFSPPLPGGPPDDVYYTTIHRVDRDYAMFAEVGFDIVPHVTLNAGIRGFMAKNTLNGFSGGLSAITRQADCVAQTVQACPNINKRYVEAGETHKVNLTWQVDPDHMIYATYSTGFRPGGNNRDAFALGRVQSFKPFTADTLTNYEIGWKTSWFDRKLRLNGAVFWEQWHDVQYSLPGLLGIFYTVNAGTARSRGIEADLAWNVFSGLTLTGSGSYTDARLTTPFCDTVNGCDPANNGKLFAPAGTRLPVQPRVKVNATARYDFDLGENRPFVQGSVNYQSSSNSSLTTQNEADLGPTSPFTTFDFSAGAKIGSINIAFFIENAFDKRGILSKNTFCAFCNPYARNYPIKPQFFGVRLGQRF